jgi:hypothetical protein
MDGEEALETWEQLAFHILRILQVQNGTGPMEVAVIC